MKVISAAVLHTFLLLTIFIIPSQAQVIMQSARTSALHATYSQSMDEVFGEGNWHKRYFESVNLDSLLSTGISYIYLEGAEVNASYMENFLDANIGKFENWVLRGGILYINAYPSGGDGMSFGFDGTVLEFPYAVVDSIIPAQPGHPVLNGIPNPQTLLLTGYNNAFASRAKINGKGLKPLLIQKGDSAVVVLAEKIWGKGKVIFGSLNSMRYVVPQPESFQLHRNILRLQNSPLANNARLEGLQASVNTCPGLHEFSVSLINYGTSALTGARINWEVNGVSQTPVQWNSLIPPFTNDDAERESLVIGNVSVEANKNYQIKAWLSQVNGAAVSTGDTVRQTVYAAMSGTYLIGADSSDFTSLAQAVSSLELAGVCGPVVFNFKPGYYSKAVIGPVPGASETNTITFQSLTGDSTDVFISGSLSSYSDNYILYFKGASYITFRNLTIQGTSGWSDYGNVILMESGAHHLSFTNNRIIGRNYQGGGSYTSVIHLMDLYNAQPFSDILFKNNIIMQGAYGIHANLSYNGMSRLTVENNRFSGHYYSAINLAGHKDLSIRDNHITGGNSYDYMGIFLNGAEGFLIAGNEVRMSQGINGFYLINSDGTAESPALVANNAIIAAGTTNNIAAIFLSSCEAVNVYHNTVNMTNGNAGSAAIRTSSGNKDLRIFNNNFCVPGAGYAAQFNFSSPDEIISDYNNYYSAGAVDFRATGTSTSTLDMNGWKALTGQDAHSISVDAAFLTPIDYRASKGALDGAGLALAEVKTDKEGNLRDIQHPDIGAYEFTADGADIKFVSLETPMAPFASGVHEVKVTVNNSGAGDINSFSIDWTVNGIAQTPYTWTGQLPKGGSANLVLGTVDFVFGAPHNVSAVITDVNGAADIDTSDNSQARTNIYAALASGNYTIGGTAPDFNSFAEVQRLLNNGGIAGPVTFLVRDGIYNEHMALSAIPGAAANSKVVFRSESGDSSKVVLAYKAESYDSNYVVKLLNTSYVSFSKMTFKAEGTSYSHVIVLEGNNSQVSFANNRITGIENPSYTYHYLVYSSGGSSEEQVFENNLLEYGSYGFYFAGSPAYGAVPSILSGNVLKDQSTYSVYLNGQAGFHITGNTITTSSTNTSYRGLYLNSCKSDIRILKNSLQYNVGNGIYLSNVRSVADSFLLVHNNFVKMGGTSSGRPLYLSNVTGADFYHNTFHAAGTNTSQYAAYIGGSNSEIRLFNNHFVQTGGATAVYFDNSNTYQQITSDYNNIFSAGSTLIYSYSAAKSNYATLKDWNTFSGHDAHSFAFNPGFTAETPYLVNNPRLNGTALPLAEVNDDMLGNPRGTAPDIGAVEFSPAGVNITLDLFVLENKRFEAGSHQIDVVVRNNGAVPVTSFAANWKANETVQPVYLWTGSLAPDASDTITIGSFDFLPGKIYSFEVNISSPNGTADADTTDNKISIPRLAASLNGTYTIGGTTPDFATFNAAANALNASGVSGKVIFNIRPGTYSEQVVLKEIRGASAEHPVIFQSENGDSTSVILSYYSTSSANYTLKLDSTDHVTFKGLTIQAENASYSTVLWLTNGCRYNTFSGNVIKALPQATSYAVILVSAGGNGYNTFEGNRIMNGYRGVEITNFSSDVAKRDEYNSFRNNIFTGSRGNGIYFYGQYYFSIEGNTIEMAENQAIDISYSYGPYQVSGNRITMNSGGRGIYINGPGAVDTARNIVANNFIHMKGTYEGRGIYLTRCNNHDLYFNTVVVSNTSAQSQAVYMDKCTNGRMFNNLLVNYGKGYAMNLLDVTDLQADHNSYFSKEGFAIGNNGSNYSLAGWQGLSSLDAHSISVDPVFAGADDLHTNDPRINNKGVAIDGISTDIDGDVRGAVPDIGADEITNLSYDMGLLAVASPVMPVAAGTHEVKVTLFNNSSAAVAAAQIHWMINDTLKMPVEWSGSLAPSEIAEVSLGSFVLSPGRPVSLKAWLADPADVNRRNDTIALNQVLAAMKGIYTIGKESSDFLSFKDAVAALKAAGVAGHVTFHVKSGTYNEQVEIPEIFGASDTSTITFRPLSDTESDAVISYSSSSASNYLIRLNGADHIKIQRLQFVPLHTSYGVSIAVMDHADHNIIDGNIFNGIQNASSENTSVLRFTAASPYYYQNNIVENNLIKNGGYGIYLSSNTDHSRGNIIRNNRLEGQTSYGIYVNSLYSVDITGNKFISGTGSGSYTAIALYYLDGTFTVSRNKIDVLNGNTGVLCTSFTGTSARQGTIANNFITIRGTSNSSGINLNSSNFVGVYFNSVLNLSANVSSNAIRSIGCKSHSVLNNIFVHKGTGVAASMDDDVAAAASIDRNNYFTAGAQLFPVHATLTDWRVSKGVDLNSVSLDPAFLSDTALRPGEVALNRLGKPVNGIYEDIDGELRHAVTPAIGADEKIPVANDAGIHKITGPVVPFPSGVNEVSVLLRNYGEIPLEAAIIHWSVNGLLKEPVQWSGNLGLGDTVQVKLGDADFSPFTAYEIKAWTSLAGGLIDGNAVNDTIRAGGLYAGLKGTYTIGGTSPDFSTIGDAVNALHLGGIAGPVVFNIRAGNYNEQVIISEIRGATSANSVIFQAESGSASDVQISAAGSSDKNYVIRLDGADGVTFRKVTFSNSSITYGRIISIGNDSDHNTFSNAVFNGSSAESTSTNLAVIYTEANEYNNDHLTITDNIFNKGSYAIYASGISQAKPQEELSVRFNTFKDFYTGGIYISYHNAPLITDNQLSTGSSNTNLRGIYVGSSSESIQILKNKIHLYAGGKGMELSSLSASSLYTPVVANNFIYVSGDKTTIGISTGSASSIRIMHNTVHVISKAVSSSETAVLLSGNNIRMFNNLLVNSGAGYAVYYSQGSFTSNYNNLFTKGEFIGYYTTQRKDLGEWKTSSRDFNSLSKDPYFISPQDFRISNGLLNDAAPQVPEVTVDIEGEPRKSMTDIGADEFTPAGADAGLEAFNSPSVPMNTGVQNINVQLYNSGSERLSSVTIYWSVNGQLQEPYNWTGSFTPRGTSGVTIGSYEFLPDQPYELAAWTAFPNGSDDASKMNDTIRFKGLSTGLAGVYYIGGAEADYPNFTKATEALKQNGVTGRVEFRVNDGIYSEQITIEPVKGASAANSITFISASQDSTKATLTFNSSSSQNHIIWLKGANYISFEKITVRAENANYANGIRLTDGASYINIRNCVLDGKRYSFSGGQYLIYSSGNNTENEFTNNLFLQGSYALYLTGTSSAYQTNRITGNEMQTQSRDAIYLSYQSGSVVHNNSISPLDNDDSYEGIYCTDSRNGIRITNNRISLNDIYSTGIYLSYVTGTSSLPVLISNNFVSQALSNNNAGIYLGNCTAVRLYHNSVSISGSSTGVLKEVCSISGGSDIDIRNNIFAHFAGGRAIGVSSNSGIVISDHNDLYTTGAVLAQWGSTSSTFATIENLQAATNKDLNSLSIDPKFAGVADLHVDQVNLDGAGTPVALVKDDIDGQQRNDTIPDIGADEFGTGLVTRNIGIVSIISPLSSCDLDGNRLVTVKIQNFGVDTVSGFYMNYVLNDTIVVRELAEEVKLKGGQAVNYTFKTPVNMDDHGLYTFDVYTSLAEDSDLSNDSIMGHVVHHYPAAFADAGRDTAFCESTQVSLTGKGGSTYTWHYLGSETVIGGNATLHVNLSSKTIFVLKAYNTYGCSDADTVVVDVRPAPEIPVITREGALEACATDTMTLTSSVGTNIVWSTGETTKSIKVARSGIFRVTHKDTLSGCSTSAMIEVVKPSLPYVTQSTSRICPGESATLSVVNGGSSFLWSTGEITSSITVKPSSTTSYSVQYGTESGCEFTGHLTVSVYAPGKQPSITAISGDSAVCPGGATVLSVIGTGETFNWSSGHSGQSVTVYPKEKTLYTVTASGGRCVNKSETASIEVDILPGPDKAPIIVATGSSSLTLCESQSIVLNSSDYSESIRWSTGDTTPSITVLTQGIYSLSHISEYGCSKTSSVKIENPPSPYITGSREICEGQSTTLTVMNGFRYKWSTGATTASITVSPDSTTEYKVEIENREGCKYEETVAVRLHKRPVITGISADTTICQGEEITLSVTGSAGEFLWTDGQTGTDIKVKPVTTTRYGVRASNGCNNESTDNYLSVNVTVLPVPEKPLILQGTAKVICPGEVLTLESGKQDSIRWSTGAVDPAIAVADTGVYKLYSINEHSCTSYSQIKVSHPPAASIVVEGNGYKTICRGDTVVLGVVNAASYQWSTGAGSRTIRVSPEDSAAYYVSAVNGSGCVYKDTVRIQVLQPAAPAEVKNLLPADNKAELTLPLSLSWSPAANASHYDLRVWEDGASAPGTPTVRDIDQITYLVKANELAYGKKYQWQVTAKNSCSETSGPVQQFELRKSPDFIVKNVIVPVSAFSGQEVQVSWEVKNQGLGRTVAKETWFDGIYLSPDSIFDADADTYLKGVVNATALDTGQSYVSSTLVRLPKGVSGTFYVFVSADNFNAIGETDNSNNMESSSRYMLVNLTPPPDLQVTEVRSLTNVFSGQQMDVSWTVTNKGTGLTETSRWKDVIYFSADSVLRASSAAVLATVEHSGHLEPGKFYASTTQVTLPQGIFGRFFVHVVTDAADNVFEHAYNNNNTGSGNPITVTLLPPSDLVPSNIIIPSAASNKDKITVEWTVKNQGGTGTSVSRWKDEIYIYNSLPFNPDKAVLAGSRTNYSALNLGESYTASSTITIPENISGSYYVFIYTDRADEVFEYESKHNNVVRSSTVLRINSPDLVVENVEVLSTEIRSGEPLQMRWVLKNQGDGIVQKGAWVDSIFVRKTTPPDTTRPVLKAAHKIQLNRNLDPGDTISFVRTIILPEGISGNWYLMVDANADRKVYEGSGGSANNIFTRAMAVTLSPWADLKVTALSSDKDTAEAGLYFPLKITVTNEGTAVTKDSSWLDKVYISRTPELSEDTVLIAGARADLILAVDSSYSYLQEVPVPSETEKGSYYFHVITDADNKIFEHTGESNNSAAYGPFHVKAAPATDLSVDALSAPDTVLTATDHKLAWTVKNVGLRPAYSGWDDAIFLSKDTLWQPDKDIYLGISASPSGLDTGEVYNQSMTVKVTEGLSGSYYWIVATDHSHPKEQKTRTNDKNRDNNVRFYPVFIRLNPAPDLTVSNLEAPEHAVAGQPASITYTVTNQGEGTTRAGSWTDKIYLSTDFKIDEKSDMLLRTVRRTDTLQPGQSYSNTMEIQMPSAASGNYILLVKTDHDDSQYEVPHEGNNISFAAIHIEKPLPVDLRVDGIRADTTQYLTGEMVNISWTVFNDGVNPVVGYEEDQFYLSRDSQWSLDDVLLGVNRTYLTLAPNSSQTYQKAMKLAAPVGEYYIIVRTDSKDQIPETNEQNNQTASAGTIRVDVKALVLNVTENTMLEHQGTLYYKFVVPDSLVGETLLVELGAEDQYNHNELYIRYNDAPTRNIYDDGFDRPFAGNQEVIISDMKPGTYYVMAYGENEHRQTQSISLKASIVHFGIRSVSTNVGGDTGPVTTCIEGAKFKRSTQFFLYANNEPVQASRIYYVSPTKVFVTFDLAGAARGYYDVLAEDTLSGESAMMLNGFRVEKGTGYVLETDLDHMASARGGWIVPVLIRYANGGNIDIPTPRRSVVYLGEKVPVALNVADLKYHFSSVNFEFTEPGGPEGILRPGVIGDITFYAWAVVNRIHLKIVTR